MLNSNRKFANHGGRPKRADQMPPLLAVSQTIGRHPPSRAAQLRTWPSIRAYFSSTNLELELRPFHLLPRRHVLQAGIWSVGIRFECFFLPSCREAVLSILCGSHASAGRSCSGIFLALNYSSPTYKLQQHPDAYFTTVCALFSALKLYTSVSCPQTACQQDGTLT